VSDDRAQIRCEVIAELVGLARRHAAGHFDLLEQATAAGKDDMATRAQANHSAWMEVSRVLRNWIPGRDGALRRGSATAQLRVGGAKRRPPLPVRCPKAPS